MIASTSRMAGHKEDRSELIWDTEVAESTGLAKRLYIRIEYKVSSCILEMCDA